MIVVIGAPAWRPGASDGSPAGTAACAAVAAARAGSRVELIGKAGEDDAGDALMLALARAGVGHVALLRDAVNATPTVTGPDDRDEALLGDEAAADAPPTSTVAAPILEAADVELALRYLPEYGVIVVAEPQPAATLKVVADAASWVGAALVVVVSASAGAGSVELPPTSIVLEAPPGDPEGAFASMLGELAAAIDRGTPVEAAFDELEAKLGLTRASG
ncbi:MAG TPA: PfkB family carbohydrate kinase [Candidatus Limnocylindrales bacterium]